MSINKLFLILKGGAGSGNIGHAGGSGGKGNPGGSAPGGGLVSSAKFLTPEERVSVRVYSGGHYNEINGQLRRGTDFGMGEHIKNLDSAFEKVKPLATNKVFYRGISDQLIPMFDKLNVGDTFTEKAYTSTYQNISSKDTKNKLREYRDGLTMTIKVPKGKKAMSIADISSRPDEREMLLPRNSTFKILSKKGTHIEVELQ